MKKIILATVIAVTFVSSYVFAHHPAADIVDPEIYAMIDENTADSPHADLDVDTMGSDDNMDGSVDAAGTGSRAAVEPDVGQAAGGPRS
ncbi:MAG: hypothetical protein KJO69_00760 [Gammaproteobacteria bacterium]|nr:hypothetical protein [Gammaproteobacteria bacterium]NNJ91204.1 hypothetical protein [Gammaproteobacteria bacterium]